MKKNSRKSIFNSETELEAAINSGITQKNLSKIFNSICEKKVE